ncbi:uncharacterized protein LOC118409615 [Branchiostoma floridae]|uniref:Uncharacterized protein LOC118409615 n=1 Tax=Branchiostoma floridae TaxID=7739 RepID=A0A9J7KMD7_BRAFL|nr:uncharacterized protein LOC118409615 [Branchiostoma floridae]
MFHLPKIIHIKERRTTEKRDIIPHSLFATTLWTLSLVEHSDRRNHGFEKRRKRHCHDDCEETDPHTEGSLELREGAGEETEGHSGEGRAHTDDDTRGGLRQDSGDHETSGFDEIEHQDTSQQISLRHP